MDDYNDLSEPQKDFLLKLAEAVQRTGCYVWYLWRAELFCAKHREEIIQDVPTYEVFYKSLEKPGFIQTESLSPPPLSPSEPVKMSIMVLQKTLAFAQGSQDESPRQPQEGSAASMSTGHQKKSQIGESAATEYDRGIGMREPEREDTITTAWGAIRAPLTDFSFTDMKEIVGLAGMDVTHLAHLQQGGTRMVTKGHLRDAMDALLRDMPTKSQRRFVRIVAEEILRRDPSLEADLRGHLVRLGWTLHGGAVIPLKLLDVSELPDLPAEAGGDLVKAATRLRDGDLSGAVSAACGAVDSVTNAIYSQMAVGDPGKASFQQRIKVSLDARDVFSILEAELTGLGLRPQDVTPLLGNLKGSLHQAAYVMQTLRSKVGDVHGTKPALRALVFDSLKWAALIVRFLSEA